ncbi:hypothetical protein A2W14_07005 [Candidatus Gottesmanbacteria bacterium RBG_16_37_8]|uniref:Uncharacterized protein n=1 Tax=Candidatus Gottesmanbacteria bacterium RBG_16_37_8 TaxID=1798371 RepID=A0A1F5YT07_9BACT|nr:MAG: hypothetical protein A2W14_07005 [Candidatus Gottesmanbacteria bacterium RBG_16_37_8]
MPNFLSKLNKNFRAKNNKIVPLLAIAISLIGIFTILRFISISQDPRSRAASINLGNLPAGCYYVRGNCTGNQSPGTTGSCKPILVCPTATPTATLTPTSTPLISLTPTPTIINPSITLTPTVKLNCLTCLNEGNSSLCLDLKDKTSSCIPTLEAVNDQNRVCVPCKLMPPTPTPYKCTFRPACLDATPPCTDQKPVEGWCTIGSPNIIFHP